jgi:hypothetical protein
MNTLKNIFLLNCRNASRLQSDALDRQLPASQRVGLRLHLLYCKWCRRYGRQLRLLRTAAQTHPDNLAESSPQTLSEPARTRIKEKLRKP